MRRIKGKEPVKNGSYFVETNMGRKVIGNYDTEAKWCPQDFPMWTDGERPLYYWDESEPKAPASAVEEAEKLYPFKKVNHELFIGCNDLAKYQQFAHITCAGMYTDTIDNLKAENSKMRKALEKSLEWIADVKQKDIPLDDKKGMALYHIKWLATEALKTT